MNLSASVAAFALLTSAAVASVAGSAAAAGTPTNGPVLYGGFNTSLLDIATGTRTSVPGASLGKPSQFSPDGSEIATIEIGCSGAACDPVSNVVIEHPGGARETVATLPGDGGYSLTWSPDATRIAVLMNSSTAPSASILTVDVASGTAHTLVSSSSTFTVEGYEQISWNPVTDEIAFVGSEVQGDSGDAVDSQQVYAVDATTGTRSRFNMHTSPSCAAPSACPATVFEDPDWSPDGSQLVVRAMYDPDINDVATSAPDTLGIATVVRGQGTPTFRYQFPDNADGYSTYAGPFFSPDGTKILFDRGLYGDSTDPFTASVMPATGGPLTDLDDPDFLDWQPCPGGVCVDWSGTAPKVPSSITLNYKVSSAVRTNGQVTPSRPGGKVTVVLQRMRQGGWVTLASKGQRLSSLSRYVIQLPLQGVFTCRAVARYAGNANTEPSQAVKYFSC